MKKTLLRASVLGGFLLATMSSVTTYAQNADRRTSISVYGSGQQARTNLGTEFWDWSDMDYGAGIRINRYLSPSFDLGLDLNYSDLKQSGPVPGFLPTPSFDNNIAAATLNLKLKMNNGKILKEDAFFGPYLRGGAGVMVASVDARSASDTFDETLTRFMVQGGAGINFRLSDVVNVFVESNLVYPFTNQLDGIDVEDELSDRYLQHVAGLTFNLGKATDTDGDGVSDKRDKCPDTPTGVQVDKQGCPLDGDKDGVPDYLDKCPTEAGTQATEGCPDRDNDGVRDSEDECPDQAGTAATRGCPDSDGDGVADKNDTCPGTPAGTRVDEKGCPVVLDRDGDGVNDDVDRCPDVAGSAANMGCTGLDAADSTYMARVPKIEFEFNRSVLKKTSFPTLDRMATMLGKYPHYNLRISGHADARGTDEYNVGLSERRADAAKSYLIDKKGIASDRIITEGFGESQPVAPNTTNAGRARNRRAEFRLFIQ